MALGRRSPTGPTVHPITGSGSAAPERSLGSLDTVTVSGGLYTVLVPPNVGVGIRKIKIETIKSPSWVAWREIEVYGCPSTTTHANITVGRRSQ